MARIKDRLVKAADRVWKTFLEYGPVDDGRPEGDEFDDALLQLRVEYKRFQIQSRAERMALIDIVNAFNATPEPCHYKVREAIQKAAKVINEWDLEIEE